MSSSYGFDIQRKEAVISGEAYSPCVAKSLLRPHLLILHASLQLCFYMTILVCSLS